MPVSENSLANLEPYKFKPGANSRRYKKKRSGFSALRKMAESEANKPVFDKDGVYLGTVAEVLIAQWARSSDPRLQVQFMNTAFGKVPDEQVINGQLDVTHYTVDQWKESRSKNLAAAEQIENDFSEDDDEQNIIEI